MVRFGPHVHAYFRTHTSSIGVAQWLACWAHNPKVPRSKRGFDIILLLFQAYIILCVIKDEVVPWSSFLHYILLYWT